MVTNSLMLNGSKKIMLYRTYTANPTTYTAPTKYKVGISQATPVVTDNDLTVPVPIEYGTAIDAGDANWTGSDGGDNTTDNTDTYKEGAGQTDNTSQNLIANDTDTSKIWTSPALTMAADQYIGIWIYVIDATALAKFSTGSEVRIRTNGDAADKYYSLPFGTLAVGWNWIQSGTNTVADLDEGAGGAPSGALDEAVISINTNNATDEFAAGDVLFDLLRQWEYSDLLDAYVVGYPTFDYTNSEVETRMYLDSLKANGFDINGLLMENTDATPLGFGIDSFTSISKSSTDEITFAVVDRLL